MSSSLRRRPDRRTGIYLIARVVGSLLQGNENPARLRFGGTLDRMAVGRKM
jgi:hypothetical protein